ncbi:hypothetical protein [Allocoleopsis franciscana]|nr:hypothetical protein [Allocoleopsis franciscana]
MSWTLTSSIGSAFPLQIFAGLHYFAIDGALFLQNYAYLPPIA